MSDDMVERVAQALWATHGIDLNYAVVRTAIAAMREPTNDMVKAVPDPREVWSAMIDAALPTTPAKEGGR